MSDSVLDLLLASTLRGSVLILVAWALAPLARRCFGPNAAHALWLAALVALLWPWPPRTLLSLENLQGRMVQTESAALPPIARGRARFLRFAGMPGGGAEWP